MRRILTVAVLIAGSLLIANSIVGQSAENQPKEKAFRIERSMPKEAVACIECHKMENPGIFSDWANSRHASANITCIDCHKNLVHVERPSYKYKQYQESYRGLGI